MTSPLVDLFGELDLIEFDPDRLADIAYVELQLARRQAIFDRLKSLDSAHLDLSTRATLLQRIHALQERDRHLQIALELQHGELADRLNSLVQGRSATRGYRPSEAEQQRKGGKRIA
jgi:hypothetical protein